MATKSIHKVLFALIVFLLLLASFFAGRMQSKPTMVQAQEILEDENRYSTGFNCNINMVSIFDNRAHIRCSNPPTEDGDLIYYFAVETTSENEMLINRMVAISLTNLAMNRYVWVLYETSASDNPPGCNTGDCRKLYSVGAQDF
jgi:hypothetical protein